MSAMDHAAAHERIEDLILEPARLRALASSDVPEDVALREHVDACPACREDLEAWEQLQLRVAAALPPSIDEAAAVTRPIETPPSLRAGVVAAARAAGSPVQSAGAPGRVPELLSAMPDRARNRRPRGALLALAASLVVLVGASILTVDQVGRREAAEADARALSSIVTAVDRVLSAPVHWVVPMRTPSGGDGGSISWSSRDLVVLTTALAAPPTGQRYRCWLIEGDAEATPIGNMFFAGQTAYWVGSLDEWATFRIGPNTRFAVTLQPGNASHLSGPILLTADLGA